MRTKDIVGRLEYQMECLSGANKDLKFYESLKNSFLDLKPENINTAGYWRLLSRKVISGEKPVAYVVSGHGNSLFLTGFVAAYDISQTKEIKKASK